MMVVKGGPRNSRTNKDNGLRFYDWLGDEFPSVTSIRSLAGMPINLAAWYRRMTIQRAISEYKKLGELIDGGVTDVDGKLSGPAFSWLWRAPDDASAKSREIGSRVHEAAASKAPLMDADEEIRPLLRQYLKWLEDSGAEVLLAERQVWNLSVGYAGTFDLIAKFKATGKVYLIDLKTGSGTYPEHAMQGEAYSRAEFVGNDGVVDVEATKVLESVDGIAILHLQPDGWSFKIIDPAKRESVWKAFCGLLDFAMWVDRTPTIDDVVVRTLKGSA
jgi:hypothetical protein